MVKDKIIKKLVDALEKVGIQEEFPLVEHPTNLQFGDYSTNIALKLAKKLSKNPLELAQQIINAFTPPQQISKVQVVPPGFINFTLSTAYLLKTLSKILQSGNTYGQTTILQGKKIMIEYTDPNPFKEFHIGHLFSNVVGESLAKLHEALGADVYRVNYQGDVGMHVAKAVWGMEKKLSEHTVTIEELNNQKPTERAQFMGQAYSLGATAYEENDSAKQEIKNLNKKIYELSDPQINSLYEKGRQWSLDYFEIIYKRLGTTFSAYFFEREVGKRGVEYVKKYLAQGIFSESEGAIVFKGEEYGLHTRVFINSLGLPTYEAKDLALPSIKYEKYPYDQSIIVTGNEINEYFQVVLKALELTQPDLRKKTQHISHGMVRLPEGKMSSRTGKVITGEWLLDMAVEKAKEKMPENNDPHTAENVGVGSIKYALLKNSIGKSTEFSFEESIAFEGNSGPYLQYTYVRCQSVLNKSDKKYSLHTEASLQGEERELARLLYQFSEIVESAGLHLAPNLIANYLYTLAQAFNLFYQKRQILKADEKTKQTRLTLTAATAQIIKNGLSLLGIMTVEKM